MIELIFGGLIEPPQSPLISTVIEEPVTDTLQKHIVLENESLYKIAEQYNTTWLRLFYKNTHVLHPDKLDVGMEIVIPEATEQLTERLYVIEPPVAQVAAEKPVQTIKRGSNAGNMYAACNCTFYAKERRPDLPNNLGNANTWATRAAAQGYATGSVPKAGAIAQRNMHVVYVESVNADGTFNLSEWNYRNLCELTTRTVSPAGWTFIY